MGEDGGQEEGGMAMTLCCDPVVADQAASDQVMHALPDRGYIYIYIFLNCRFFINSSPFPLLQSSFSPIFHL